MNHLGKGKSTEDFIFGLNDIEKIRFIAFFEEVYPVQENMIKSDDLAKDKNISENVDDLVLGQFIMLEQIITGKTKLPDHLVDLEIAKLIVRPKDDLVFDNEDYLKESNNQEDILDLDVRKVYYILNGYIENRNKTLFKDFAGVFYEPEDEEQEDDKEDSDNDMIFNQQWYWYSIVRMLSGDDIHKYEQTYMLSMRTVLPEMSYLAQKSKIESANQRQQAALRKL
tara:strand:- start:3966 stop:4640 length:675 start_codon:yes stop_codon:yes gene_type:complete